VSTAPDPSGLATTGYAPIRLPVPSAWKMVTAAAVSAAVSVLAGWWLTLTMGDVPTPLGGSLSYILTAVSAVATVVVVFPLVRSAEVRGRAVSVAASGDRVTARRRAALVRRRAAVSMGMSGAYLILVVLLFFLLANHASVQKTFLQPELIKLSFSDTLSAFERNVFIAVVAEVLVLVCAMFIALARTAKADAARPLRILATAYTDVFRGIPSIIVVYLVGFGLPLTNLPFLKDISSSWYAIIALTLTYTAYVSEVYRSGLESIHPSQVAAARSLGFGYLQTMRVVVAPQGVRRVIPPLLNDFIALQKDTAVVGVIGSIEAFNQAKIYAGNHFNLSSVTMVALFFLVITVPQARLLDHIIARQNRKQGRS
jgi:polar amino acid transport system permease protein